MANPFERLGKNIEKGASNLVGGLTNILDGGAGEAAREQAKAAAETSREMADVAREQLGFSREQYDRFKQLYGDLESEIVSDVRTGGLPKVDYGQDTRVQNDVMRAADDVRSGFRGLRAQQENDMVRYNIDPSSGRYAGGKRALALSEAAQLAAAKSNTRQGSSRFYEGQDYSRANDSFNKKMSVLSVGKGLPALAANTMNQAGNTLGGATSGFLGVGGLHNTQRGQNFGLITDLAGSAAGYAAYTA